MESREPGEWAIYVECKAILGARTNTPTAHTHLLQAWRVPSHRAVHRQSDSAALHTSLPSSLVVRLREFLIVRVWKKRPCFLTHAHGRLRRLMRDALKVRHTHKLDGSDRGVHGAVLALQWILRWGVWCAELRGQVVEGRARR